jgi:excisionase family DNA binding protein
MTEETRRAFARFHQALARAHAALADELLKAPPASEASPVVERLLTVQEAAAKLGFSPTFIYRRALSLPFMRRHGRSWRASQQALDEYVRSVGRPAHAPPSREKAGR